MVSGLSSCYTTGQRAAKRRTDWLEATAETGSLRALGLAGGKRQVSGLRGSSIGGRGRGGWAQRLVGGGPGLGRRGADWSESRLVVRHLGKAESRSGTEVPVYPRRTHRRRRRGIRVGARTRALPRATVSVGLAAASGAAPGTPSGAVSTLAGAAPPPPPGAQPGRRGTLPDVPAAGLKGPVPAPCPHPSRGEAAPLKGAAPGRPHLLSRGLAVQDRAGRGAAGALKGTGKVSAGVPTSPPWASLPDRGGGWRKQPAAS